MADCEQCWHYYPATGNESPECSKQTSWFVRPEDECENFYSRKYKFRATGKPTNSDHIRTMTDDELAGKISAHMDCYTCPLWNGNACYRKFCKDHWLDWLKQEMT